jgi:hypothetical protein
MDRLHAMLAMQVFSRIVETKSLKGFRRLGHHAVVGYSHGEKSRADSGSADDWFTVENISYFLIRSSSMRNAVEAEVFRKWLFAGIKAANLKTLQ